MAEHHRVGVEMHTGGVARAEDHRQGEQSREDQADGGILTQQPGLAEQLDQHHREQSAGRRPHEEPGRIELTHQQERHHDAEQDHMRDGVRHHRLPTQQQEHARQRATDGGQNGNQGFDGVAHPARLQRCQTSPRPGASSTDTPTSPTATSTIVGPGGVTSMTLPSEPKKPLRAPNRPASMTTGPRRLLHCRAAVAGATSRADISTTPTACKPMTTASTMSVGQGQLQAAGG